MRKPRIYTIGHSTHPIERFLQLLKLYDVNCIVDVRSAAASRFNPQYNKKLLAAALDHHGIRYLHFAVEFGARQTDPALLDDDGLVDFEKMRRSDKFQAGINRLRNGIKNGYVIALMCAEADPLQCHRFGMISPALRDFAVVHILKDASVVNQQQLEQKLVETYSKKMDQLNIFQTIIPDNERLSLAFGLLNKEMGYSPPSHRGDSKA